MVQEQQLLVVVLEQFVLTQLNNLVVVLSSLFCVQNYKNFLILANKTGKIVLIIQIMLTARAIAGMLSVYCWKMMTAHPPLSATSAAGSDGMMLMTR